jgi:hypothetical protein
VQSHQELVRARRHDGKKKIETDSHLCNGCPRVRFGWPERLSDYKYFRPPAHTFFFSQLSSSPCPPQLPPFSPFLFLLFALLVAVMARSALSAFVALVSLTLVAGQTTAAPAAASVSTFPATPLISEIFPYTALVRIFSSNPNGFLH